MKVVDLILHTFSIIKENKIRAFFTILGVSMGIFSLVTIMTIRDATNNYISAEFQKLGSNVISVLANPSKNLKSEDLLQLDDLNYLSDNIVGSDNIGTYSMRIGSLTTRTKNKDCYIFGITSQYKSFSPIEMLYGRYISNLDVKNHNNTLVIDEDLAMYFFNSSDVVGREISIKDSNDNSFTYQIVGVYKIEKDNPLSSLNTVTMPIVYIPITSLNNLYNINNIDRIDVSVKQNEDYSLISKKIVTLLGLKHNNTNKDVYMIQNTNDTKKSLNGILDIVSSVLFIFGAITLTVGGIGIVNILIISVTERTKEIGIHRAIGAKKKHIIFQFLFESITYTIIAGIIGIFIASSFGAIVIKYMKLKYVFSIKSIIIALTSSLLLGIIFGVYPALRAADLNPIDAIRHE